MLRWVVGAIGLVTGVALLFTQARVWTVVSLAIGVFLLFRGVRRFMREWRRLRPVDGSRPRWEYQGPYGSWLPIGEEGRTHAIYSSVLNERLRDDQEILVTVGEAWMPTGSARDLRQRLWINKGKQNDPKYRLSTDLLEDSTSVTLDVTDYGAYVATNRLAYQYWWDQQLEEPALTFERVEPLTEVGLLPTLVNSTCSNHIGGDLLAVGDGFTYLQLQAATNGMYPSRWVGSSSGSFDLSDLTESHRLQDLVKTGMLRELEEEMDLQKAQVPTLEDTKIVGYSRATYLGGKPQFYGVARITRVNPGKDKYVDRFARLDFEGGVHGLVEELEKFAAKHYDVLAPPLEMLLIVVKRWIQEDQEASGWLWPTRAM